MNVESIPPAVRLDDLSAPVFPSEVADLMALGASMASACPIDADAILEQAARETGLDDFGPTTYREPLEVLTAAIRDEGALSEFGQVSVHTLLVGLAKNRLFVQELLTREPQIRDVSIERPIVIVGQPRTGTTHLHNLLSSDPALRSLPYWESMCPVPPPGQADERIAAAEMATEFTNAAMPLFVRMHEMDAHHVHEEIQILAMEFATMLFDSMMPLPSYREWYKAHDHTPHYEYLRTVMQAMTHLRGGDRWVLKSPQHLEQLPVLHRVFPDATVLITHRDPVSVTASLVAMLSYTARLQQASPDPLAIGAYWRRQEKEMLDAVVRDRDVVPASHSLDVLFTEFMADDLAMVERIYHLAEQPLDASARHAHERYLAGHQRDRHGKVVYDLEPFGLDARDLREHFADYSNRFSIPAEWPV
jgi:hypothetical protein